MKYSYEWISVEQGLPDFPDWYLVTIVTPFGYGYVKETWFDGFNWQYELDLNYSKVISWRNLPKPYVKN